MKQSGNRLILCFTFLDCFGLRLPMTTALAVIAMSEAKKQSRISSYFMLYFSGLLRLAPRNDGYAERTGLSSPIVCCLQYSPSQ
jgi:hypothetical protein